MENLGQQIVRAGSFLGYSDEDWVKLPKCPTNCEYLRSTMTTKYLCDHPDHPMNEGMGRLSQRLKTMMMDCPMES